MVVARDLMESGSFWSFGLFLAEATSHALTWPSERSGYQSDSRHRCAISTGIDFLAMSGNLSGGPIRELYRR